MIGSRSISPCLLPINLRVPFHALLQTRERPRTNQIFSLQQATPLQDEKPVSSPGPSYLNKSEEISTGNEQSARHHVHCEQYVVNSVESARDLNSERLSRESRGTKAPSSSSRLRRSPLKSRALSTDYEKKRGTALSQGTLGI